MEAKTEGASVEKRGMPELTEAQLSASPTGRYTQLQRVLEKVSKVFERIEPGQVIIIDGNKYYLRRGLDYCNPGYGGWEKDWVYDLRREDGKISIRTYYHHNSPQNYMVTEELTYNGVITTSDETLIAKMKGAFESYFVENPLPL